MVKFNGEIPANHVAIGMAWHTILVTTFTFACAFVGILIMIGIREATDPDITPSSYQQLQALKSECVLRGHAEYTTDEHGHSEFVLKEGNGRSGPFNYKYFLEAENGKYIVKSIEQEQEIKRLKAKLGE